MTASLVGSDAGKSPTYNIGHDINALLAQREQLLSRAAHDLENSLLAAISCTAINTRIAVWLARHVPRSLLEQAADTDLPQEMYRYNPDYVSHPSETIHESLEALGKGWRELHVEGGLMKRHAQYVVRGAAPITESVALALETTTGVPASFWLNRQARYDAWRKGAA